MIALLVGHIFQATVNRIAKVEEDYHKMTALKKKAEDADIAKSQVFSYFNSANNFSPILKSVFLILFWLMCSFWLLFHMKSELL